MSDPRSVLAARLQHAVVAAFGAEFAGVDPMVRASERADYQADLAMGLAKPLKRAPRQVAEAVLAQADFADICAKVEIAGPGFINFTLAREFLEQEVGSLARDSRLGVPLAERPEKVVIDYSAPNVAKEMHVGHLRTTIIGDALARIFELLGHEVVPQNHIGDWGTPFGMLIEHLLDVGQGDASGAEASVGELNEFYRAARAKFDEDPVFADRARQRVVQLQAGDARTLELWRKLVNVSQRHFREIYARLGVQLGDEDVRGESSYNDALADVAAELTRQGLARISDGALCVFAPGFANRDGEPLPLIVRKQDGGYGYAATDLAALRYRTQVLRATRLLYVVGAPQQQHFAMVFAVAELAGWLSPGARAEHVAFGAVLGADKKMLKTRSGEAVRLADLLDEAVERAAAELERRDPEAAESARRELAQKIGIGAVKYADLANDRIKDYVFDWERMLAVEGRTGPYLQYAHARIHSIFRKAAETGIERSAQPGRLALADPAERALALCCSASAAPSPRRRKRCVRTGLRDTCTTLPRCSRRSSKTARCCVRRTTRRATPGSRSAS